MNKVISFVRRAPTRVVALATLVVASLIVPASLHAWGPSRATFTMQNPATYVTFNSITDNPNLGDERNFTSVREVGSTGAWQDAVTVQPGKEYEVRVYVHNNAASNLGLVANDVKAKVNVPTTTGNSVRVMAYVNSSNATPTEVYDQADFNSTQTFNLAYIAGSAKYYNNVFGKYGVGSGVSLPDSLVTSTGATLGYNKLDGHIPGCMQYAGVVVFHVKPQFAGTQNFTMSKLVSKHGANSWVENYTAQPGETVDYLLQYKNTGTLQQDNVTFRDTLPAHMTYVAGSTIYGNSQHPSGTRASDNITKSTGINVGSYAAGANAWAIFSAKVDGVSALACGVNSLHNIASVTPQGVGVKSDGADVTVTRTCVQPKPIEVCRLADKKIVTIDEKDFDSAKYSKNLDDCRTITVCELGNQQIVTITVSQYNRYKDRYSTDLNKCKPVMIKVCRLSDKTIVTINERDFDGAKYSKNLDDCKPPVMIKVCDLTTNQVVTINEKDFNSTKYSKNLDDCAPIKVCELSSSTVITIAAHQFDSTKHSKNLDDCVKIQVCRLDDKQIVTIKKSEFDSKKYSQNLDNCREIKVCRLADKQVVTIVKSQFDSKKYSMNLDDCKETPKPVMIDVCRLSDKKIVSIDEKDFTTSKYSKTLDDCKEVTQPPKELPHTGVVDGIASVVGLGSLVAAGGYYLASRRALR